MSHRVFSWERPSFQLDGESFVPLIYDGPLETIPAEFNALIISLDASIESNLNWKWAEKIASQAASKGLLILWELKLGLFSGLKQPLSDQTQYMALNLSIKNFLETLWKLYKSHTLGVILYRGSALWTDQESMAAFFNLIAEVLPEVVEPFLLVDVTGAPSPISESFLLHRELFSRFHLGIKGSSIPHEGLVWEDSDFSGGYIGKTLYPIKENPFQKVGICLPFLEKLNPSVIQLLDKAIYSLKAKQESFRIIPEAYLTGEWDGLDSLIVVPHSLGDQGLRKLQGFCAAGGLILNMGEPLNLAYEQPFLT